MEVGKELYNVVLLLFALLTSDRVFTRTLLYLLFGLKCELLSSKLSYFSFRSLISAILSVLNNCVCGFDEIHDGSRSIAKMNHICFGRRKLFLTSDFCCGLFGSRLQQHESFEVEHKIWGLFWKFCWYWKHWHRINYSFDDACSLIHLFFGICDDITTGDLDLWRFLLTVSFATSSRLFALFPCPLASWKFVSKSSRCLVLRNKNWSVRWVCLSTFWLHVGMESAFFFEQLWWWRCVLQTRRKVWKYTTVSPVSLRYFAKVVKVVRGTFTQVVWMQNWGDVYRREG